jgi:hypothetical protein
MHRKTSSADLKDLSEDRMCDVPKKTRMKKERKKREIDMVELGHC